MANPWEDVPCLFITRPRCQCGCSRFITVRSEANGDGSVTRKSKCRACSRRLKVVVELEDADLPDIGNDDFAEG